MKRRDLTLLSFKKVLFKAWTKLALIWKRLQSSLMPLAPSSITAVMLRLSSTSWWLEECWVSNYLWLFQWAGIEINHLNSILYLYIFFSPRRDSVWWLDPYWVLPLHGKWRPGDHAGVRSGIHRCKLLDWQIVSRFRACSDLTSLWWI